MNSDVANNCPDEQALLDYLEGELRPEAALDVGQHLKVCTDCALRADQLCEDLADIERAMQVELPLPPLRLAAARARLQEQQEAYEASRVARAPRFPLVGARARLAFVAAVAVITVGALATLYLLRDAPVLTAGEVLARAEESIPTFSIQPSMTRYEVEVAQLNPELATRRHQLVIWTDPSSGGYVSRLEDPDGSLRHAVWRPASSEPAFAFSRATGGELVQIDAPSQRAQPTLLASMGDGIDTEALVTGFARWLESRDWRPLRVSRDFALLAARDTTVRLERTGEVILVMAHKQEGDVSKEVTLTLSAESYEARSLLIHFRSPQGEATFKLVQNEVRFIAASYLDASVFEPRVPGSRGLRASTSPATQPEPNPKQFASLDLRTTETRLRLALHQAGACLGEPVEVVRSGGGALTVRGIVGTSEMKDAILAELQRAETPGWVAVDIRTRGEAIAASGAQVEVDESPTQASSETARPTDRAVRALPLFADLTAYFRMDAAPRSPESVGNDLTQFAREAVERADDLLRRAWALKRLVEHYGPVSQGAISPEARALVGAMIRDHLDGIGTAARRSADWMLPALGAIAASRGVDVVNEGDDSRGSRVAGPWPDSLLSLFERASSIHRDTLSLLTVRLTITHGSANGSGPIESEDAAGVDRTLGRLLAASRSFEAEVDGTANAFAMGAPQSPTAPYGRGAER
ncbi:MAG: hypothetical protein OXN89_21780 [Bryobacterales bacterium]|nr:hypothetical protein [Bryobacterales bacterium]